MDKDIGNFQICEEIGKGGMAVVYKAIQKSLSRIVALKFLPEHLAGDEETLRRFKGESEIIARLNHHNILQIHDIVCEEDKVFLVLEYCENGSLEQMLARDNRLELSEAIAIARVMCQGLAAAHTAGIVHRDIKPSNILFNAAGVVKIADFGIARIIDSERQTHDQKTLGTVAYMSPEQIEGKRVDNRSDLYSLGVCLYHMLMGRVLFEDTTPFGVARKHIEAEPNLDAIQTHLPYAFYMLMHRLLQKDPAKRPASAGEVARELDAIENEPNQDALDSVYYIPAEEDLSASERMTTSLTLVYLNAVKGERGLRGTLRRKLMKHVESVLSKTPSLYYLRKLQFAKAQAQRRKTASQLQKDKHLLERLLARKKILLDKSKHYAEMSTAHIDAYDTTASDLAMGKEKEYYEKALDIDRKVESYSQQVKQLESDYTSWQALAKRYERELDYLKVHGGKSAFAPFFWMTIPVAIAIIAIVVYFFLTDNELKQRTARRLSANAPASQTPGQAAITRAPVDYLFTAGPSMYSPREHFTATRLTSGDVLVAGGFNDGALSSAEMYSAQGERFLPLAPMNTARFNHQAVELADGSVLITGGEQRFDRPALASVELFVPDEKKFFVLPSMTTARRRHTATLLDTGDVLIIGGVDEKEEDGRIAELYRSESRTFEVLDAKLSVSRKDHSATRLRDGRLLIAGGSNEEGKALTSAEIYNPEDNTFTLLRAGMNVGRSDHTATLLYDGRVLITGGMDSAGNKLDSAEVFDPDTETFSVAGKMNIPRVFHTVTLLTNGDVLIVGGNLERQYADVYNVEVFDITDNRFKLVATLEENRSNHQSVLLDNYHVMVIGGYCINPRGMVVKSTEVCSLIQRISK